MISELARNILLVIRTSAEIFGYTIAACWALIAGVEHEASVWEFGGIVALFCMLVIGTQIAQFALAKERQKKADRADAKARAPLPENPRPNARPQVSPWQDPIDEIKDSLAMPGKVRQRHG